MDLGLANQTVLVTGSSSGVGRAAAIAFGREGAKVAVTYHRNQSGADETASQVQAVGSQALVLQYDLTNADSIRASVDRIRQEWGSLNVLVNNAAPMDLANPSQKLFEEIAPQEWRTMLSSSLDGVILTIQAVLPLMRTSGWGRIINVSSTTATDGWPRLTPYGAAKAGIHGLTRTLALELGPANILTNVVSLGAVSTERNLEQVSADQREQIRLHTPTRRLVTPEDVAEAIVYLGSQANRQITGEVIRVTGGV
jgi:3-oxoacyl-[acyl-carrier protein] reductase